MKAINKLNKIIITLFTNNMRGVSCLKYFIKKKIKISDVIISKKNLDPRVITFLNKNNIKFILIKNLKNKKISKLLKKTELGLVCGFPHIFKSFHFNKSKYGFINLHAGKLPKYRGGSPLNWQIINNEKYFGISVIKIDKGIDSGDIIFEKKFKLLNKYKIEDLHFITNNHFPKLLLKSMFKIISGKKLKKQDKKKAKYFKQRGPQDSLIIPNKITFKKLNLLLRALSNSYQSPYFIYKNKKIFIKKIEAAKSNLTFKNEYILFKSNQIYLKLKDKVIKLYKK